MNKPAALTLKHLGIDTQNEAVVYLRADSQICLSEGFVAQTRIRVQKGDTSIIATLNTVTTTLLHHNEAGLSECAWKALGAHEGDEVTLSHPRPLSSLSFIRKKIYGHALKKDEIHAIVDDAVGGRLSDVHLSAFVASCVSARMNENEVLHLTEAMVNVGKKLSWGRDLVVDKHCVGGLPANRTTPIVVAIVAAYGLTIPKTSSRAITSPAGTADTMEVLAPVELTLPDIHRVVEKENGCVVWGGAVALSPADDVLIRVERALDLDGESQLVASVLSKKIAAGSTHIVIDIPVGPTAKVYTNDMALRLKKMLEDIGGKMGLTIKVALTEGFEPVGFGIGPALEARDIVRVLQNHPDAPADLREHALLLAGHILEFSPKVEKGQGLTLAAAILADGRAWKKLQAICDAQGGMRDIPLSQCQHVYTAPKSGRVSQINSKRLGQLAKLAGAPQSKTGGIDLHAKLQHIVEEGQPLFTIHTQSPGEMDYALSYLHDNNMIIQIEEME